MLNRRPLSDDVLEQTLHAIADILKTVVNEEAAIGNLLKLEKEIIQKAQNGSASLEEYVAINESANSIIHKVTKAQLLSQVKIQHLEDLIQKIKSFRPNAVSEAESAK